MPYDVDGYIPPEMTEDHNYCRHGVYVGGCGYDHMCGWCESGEEPPTQRELDTRRLAKAERDYDELVRILDNIVAEGYRSRAWAINHLSRMAFDIHRSSWPINGSVVLAWQRTHQP